MSPERDSTRRRSGRKRAAAALLLTVLAHALFAVLLAVSAVLWPPPPPVPSPQPVALRAITQEQWSRNREVEGRQAAAAEAAPEQKPEPEANPRGQVVDVAPGNGQKSKDARFLAPTANSVEKETRAREQTAFYRNAMPQRTRQGKPQHDGADPVDQAMPGGNGGRGNDRQPEAEQGQRRAAVEIPTARRREEIRLRPGDGPGAGPRVANRTASDDLQGNSHRLLVQPGEATGGEHASLGHAGPLGLANLMPSPGVLDQIAGAAPNDHLEDVEEGQGTFLNTQDWKYAGFMNRVRQRVGELWNPLPLLFQRDPTGNIHGRRGRFTWLRVTLDDRGQLQDTTVAESSGLDFLDQEAVHAFERAEIFPNPPRGLIEDDGLVHFVFGFYVERSLAPSIRVHWQAY